MILFDIDGTFKAQSRALFGLAHVPCADPGVLQIRQEAHLCLLRNQGSQHKMKADREGLPAPVWVRIGLPNE